jgi:hypothetical protein
MLIIESVIHDIPAATIFATQLLNIGQDRAVSDH